ncbi:MAG: type IX secretion system membrane protein PorP/SprF [Elusimicrobiota bacterium]
MKNNYELRIMNNKLKTKKMVFCLGLICYLSFIACHLFAAFDELNIGARPQGLGGAFTAIADDVNALFYNPAGISNLKKSEITSSYGRLFIGLDDNSAVGSSFIGYARPTLKYGTSGISLYNLSLSNLYSETTIGLSHAYQFDEYLSAGITVKNLSKKFGSDPYIEYAVNQTGDETRLEKEGIAGDPVFDKTKKSSVITADMGLLYSYSKNISLGVSVKNITQPNIGLTSKDKISAVYRSGVCYKTNDYLLSFEMMNKDTDINILTGAEKWFPQKNITVRSGLLLGSRRLRTISCGFSYKFDNLSFDYAFLWSLSGIKDTIGVHKIALNIKFEKRKITKKKEVLPEPPKKKNVLLKPVKKKEVLPKKQIEYELEVEKEKVPSEAEKLQQETERIRLELIEKQKEAQRVEEQARKLRLQKISNEQDAKIREAKRKSELEKSFRDSMFQYQKQVFFGIGIRERLLLLDKIIKNYNNKGVDISDILREKKEVLKIRQGAIDEYDYSVLYYKQLKARGATKEEIKSLLGRIVEKYKVKGVDVSELESELELLK